MFTWKEKDRHCKNLPVTEQELSCIRVFKVVTVYLGLGDEDSKYLHGGHVKEEMTC